MRRRQIFFEKKFHSIRRRLQKSEWPYSCGSPSVLHASHHLALQPNAVGDRGQHHKQRQGGLNQRRDDVYPYAQGTIFLCVTLRPLWLSFCLRSNQSAPTSV